MERWVDPDITERYGLEASSMVNGVWVTFDVADKNKILAALRRRGYSCVHDQGLIDLVIQH